MFKLSWEVGGLFGVNCSASLDSAWNLVFSSRSDLVWSGRLDYDSSRKMQRVGVAEIGDHAMMILLVGSIVY